MQEGVEIEENGARGTWVRSAFLAPQELAFLGVRLELFEQKLAAILLRSRGGQGEPLRFRESETAAAF